MRRVALAVISQFGRPISSGMSKMVGERAQRLRRWALTRGPDPLHLAEVFGLDDKTAMRYADSARALLEEAAEQQLRCVRASAVSFRGAATARVSVHPG